MKLKAGTTDFTTHVAIDSHLHLKVVNGAGYVSERNGRIHPLHNDCYTDAISNGQMLILASYHLIEVYKGKEWVISFLPDDIDGIELNSIDEAILHGTLKNIGHETGIPFTVDLTKLEFRCDYGRMWREITADKGAEKTTFRTMGLN